MKANEIMVGMSFYDEKNSRTIKVDNINTASKTAMCTVEEPKYNDQWEEEDTEFYYQSFTLQELTHYSLNS